MSKALNNKALLNDLPTPSGAGEIGAADAGNYFTGTTVLTQLQELGAKASSSGVRLSQWAGVDPTGTSECGAAIRLAMAEAETAGIPLVWCAGDTYRVGPDPASPLAAGFRTYCLKPGSGAAWVFEPGATILQDNGSQSWVRVVSLEGVDNFACSGTLKVDANVAGRGATTNEHMHGVFLYNTTNTAIDAIDSRNARGDNIFIGGTDESTFGDAVYIGRIYAAAAGRKNLTLHYCDNLVIGTAVLDNSAGGAILFSGVGDTTDKHCLDVEPDSYTGSKTFRQYIGALRTYGLGNDFTAGTTPLHGDSWVVAGNDWSCVQSGTSSTVPAWEMNAITVSVNTLSISGCAGHDMAVSMAYAARLFVSDLRITGASGTSAGYLMQAAAAGGDENKPELRVDSMKIVNTVGNGCDFRSAVADIGTFDAQCVGHAYQAGESVSSASLRGGLTIGHLVTRDTGTPTTGAIFVLTTFALGGYPVTVRKATLLDTRATKVGSLASVGSGNAAGLCIGEFVNPQDIPVCVWIGTDTYYRLAGGPWGTTPKLPGLYVSHGTPEGIIPAAVGSLTMRDDGAAGTSLYVKQAGTGTAGWVGK